MENLLRKLLHLCMIGVSVLVMAPSSAAGQEPQLPAMFVFGDSLVDHGNNNYLVSSLAKANYFPYGINFFGGLSGRFSNGKTIIDFLGNNIASLTLPFPFLSFPVLCFSFRRNNYPFSVFMTGELMGLPYLPPYVNTIGDSRSILRGVNFASAAAGILDESGTELGDRFSLNRQIANFKSTVNQLRSQMEAKELERFLAKSLVVMNLGSNDYLNNYLMPSIYPTSSIYNPRDFADLLISNYTNQILVQAEPTSHPPGPARLLGRLPPYPGR